MIPVVSDTLIPPVSALNALKKTTATLPCRAYLSTTIEAFFELFSQPMKHRFC